MRLTDTKKVRKHTKEYYSQLNYLKNFYLDNIKLIGNFSISSDYCTFEEISAKHQMYEMCWKKFKQGVNRYWRSRGFAYRRLHQ